MVQAQSLAPRHNFPVLSAALGENGRSIVLRTPARTQADHFAAQLPFPASPGDESKHIQPRSAGVDVGFDRSGVEATWRPVDGEVEWAGWLPHPDWTVASELTAASEPHERLRLLVARLGLLTISGQLDPASMLHPAVQPGSTLDFEYPPETVTVVFEARSRLTIAAEGRGGIAAAVETSATLTTTGQDSRLVPFSLTVATGRAPLSLTATWSTADDPRPRAIPLRRVLMPWVTPADAKPTEPSAEIPEIAGGDWAAGRTLFFGAKLNCAACHAIRGEGGKIAPELTNLIHRDYVSVKKDIRRPNATISPDFLSYLACCRTAE